MSQMTLRTSEELMQRIRTAAKSQDRSLNDYVSLVLDAATNPDLAGSAAERVRERLAAAGLVSHDGVARPRPSAAAVATARKAAGRGKRLSQIVVEGRG